MRRAWLAVVVAGLAGCGGEDADRFDPFTEVRDRTVPREERASPRWETVSRASGDEPARHAFSVASGSIQWRARWKCRSGRLRLATAETKRADAKCPDEGVFSDVSTGDIALDVGASGPWQVTVEQQVDTPLREPPTKAMHPASVLARGSFYGIERKGRGTAVLHRLQSGRLALRFEDFSTSPNSDLFVWLSRAARPRTTVQAARARHIVLRELKSTLGEQNYLLPAGVRASDIRSVVIWCVPVRIAYTAAAMRAE